MQGYRDVYGLGDSPVPEQPVMPSVTLGDIFAVYRDGNEAGLITMRERNELGRAIRQSIGLSPVLPFEEVYDE